MATNYGNGLVSRKGKLTLNGVAVQELDTKTLNSVLSYLTHGFSTNSRFNQYFNSQGAGFDRENLAAERAKVGKLITSRGGTPDFGKYRNYSLRDLRANPSNTDAIAAATGMAAFRPALPQQAVQASQAMPQAATGSAMSSASRAYANLIARQRNFQQLGV
jgi:hypothetical protein